LQQQLRSPSRKSHNLLIAVDHKEKEGGDRVMLTKNDPKAGGHRYLISIDWLDYVDRKVHLNRPSQKAMSALLLKAGTCGAKTDVRYGSLADICSATGHVRFTPNSDGKSRHAAKGRVCFTPGSGHVRCKPHALHDWTVRERTRIKKVMAKSSVVRTHAFV
jgi:hypothetical protein